MRYLVDVGRLIAVEEKNAHAAAAAAVIARLADPEPATFPELIFVHELASGSIETFRFAAPADPPAPGPPRRTAEA